MSGAIIGGTMDFVQQFNGGYDIDYDRLNQAVTSGMVSGAIGGAVMGAFSGGLQGLKSAKLLRKNNPKVNVKDSQKTINKDTKKSFEQTAKKQTSIQNQKYKDGNVRACVKQNGESYKWQGRTRVADEKGIFKGKKFFGEVKNTKSLSLTSQFKDYFGYCKKNTIDFVLYADEATHMSKPLLNGLIDVGADCVARNPFGMLVYGSKELLKEIFKDKGWGEVVFKLVETMT